MKEDRQPRPPVARDDTAAFYIHCQADSAGLLKVGTDTVSFTVAQRIVLENKEQLFESVRVRCQKEDDGSLTVQVLVWAPDLDGALQIARLTSWPSDRSSLRAPLLHDLNHKVLG
jgi:hypothetical protein